MKSLIEVFSGTGNTRLVAERIAFYLGNTTIRDITAKTEPEDYSSYDVVGFGYPVHAFRAPEIFIRYLRRLPQVDGKRCFLFKTSGEGLHLNDASSLKAIRILRKKGFAILGEAHFLMPYNIIRRFTDSLAKTLFVYADAKAYLLASDLKKSNLLAQGKRFPVRIIPPLFRIEWWFAKTNGRHYKVDMSKCLRCFRCVRECPSQNIVFDGKHFRFKKDCTMCLRCAFYCPTDAISIGLINAWKVNGDYHLNQLAVSPSIPLFEVKPRGIIEKTAVRYCHGIDHRLKAEGLTISFFQNTKGGTEAYPDRSVHDQSV